MDRKWMIGIGVGLLAAATLIAVGAGAYELGQRDNERVLVTGTESIDGRIIVEHDGWRGGPGFLVFPLLIAGVIFLVVSRRRYHGWYGPGPGWDREAAWRYGHDWRGWHGDERSGPAPYGTPTPPVPTPPDRDQATSEGSGEGGGPVHR